MKNYHVFPQLVVLVNYIQHLSFEEVFTKILTKCVEKVMDSGHTQTIDSAPIKANALMDSLEMKVRIRIKGGKEL